jgi:hypothetical protein
VSAVEVDIQPRVGATRVFDGFVRPGARDLTSQVVGDEVVDGLEAEAAVQVQAQLEPRAAEELLAEDAHAEVFRRDVGALDGPPRRGRGIAILVGALIVGAEERVHADAPEVARILYLVCCREAMRVLVGIVEAHRLRVVARTLDVAAEVALPAHADHAGPPAAPRGPGSRDPQSPS